MLRMSKVSSASSRTRSRSLKAQSSAISGRQPAARSAARSRINSTGSGSSHQASPISARCASLGAASSTSKHSLASAYKRTRSPNIACRSQMRARSSSHSRPTFTLSTRTPAATTRSASASTLSRSPMPRMKLTGSRSCVQPRTSARLCPRPCARASCTAMSMAPLAVWLFLRLARIGAICPAGWPSRRGAR